MEHFTLNPEEQLIGDNQTYFTDERQPYHYPHPRPYPYYPWYGYGGGYGY
jgi:hypothetical protein